MTYNTPDYDPDDDGHVIVAYGCLLIIAAVVLVVGVAALVAVYGRGGY